MGTIVRRRAAADDHAVVGDPVVEADAGPAPVHLVIAVDGLRPGDPFREIPSARAVAVTDDGLLWAHRHELAGDELQADAACGDDARWHFALLAALGTPRPAAGVAVLA